MVKYFNTNIRVLEMYLHIITIIEFWIIYAFYSCWNHSVHVAQGSVLLIDFWFVICSQHPHIQIPQYNNTSEHFPLFFWKKYQTSKGIFSLLFFFYGLNSIVLQYSNCSETITHKFTFGTKNYKLNNLVLGIRWTKPQQVVGCLICILTFIFSIRIAFISYSYASIWVL